MAKLNLAVVGGTAHSARERNLIMALPVLERGPMAVSEHERDALARLEHLLETGGGGTPKVVGPGGEQIDLPEAVVHLLRQVVHAMAQDQAVTVIPVHKQLTTQQAADVLNVSRPYLVHLLNAGEIPYVKTGSHRRIRFDDLMAYKQRRDAERQVGLDRLSQLGQDMGLYSKS